LHEKFKVERATGKITSDYKMLENLSLEPLTVQDLPGGNSYKVLTSNDRKYLEIKKYVKEPQKPFIYKLGFIIATGLCTYI
jgi:hypothetical protein